MAPAKILSCFQPLGRAGCGMCRRWVVRICSLAAITLLAGCYTTTTTRTPVGRPLRPPEHGSALSIDLTPTAEAVEIVVHRRLNCRALYLQQRIDTRAPDPIGNGLLITLGAASGIAGIAVVATAGEERVGSLRRSAQVVGAGLIVVGGGLLIPPIYAQTREPERSYIRESIAEKSSLMPCGTGPVIGLSLRLVHGKTMIARATTDAQSRARLPHPPAGEAEVVVDAVPEDLEALVRPGEVLGRLRSP